MRKGKYWKICIIGILAVLLILGGCIAATFYFSDNIKALEVKRLNETAEEMDEFLFADNIYLTPDTAYFYKLERLLRTGEGQGEAGTFAGMIQKNLSNGALYDSNIYSVYTALADETAPYVLVNGLLRKKEEMRDMEWWNMACGMEEDCYLTWRKINSSYLNRIDLITLYRRYDSVSYVDGGIVRGYMVINFYASHILNELSALCSLGEDVILYQPEEDRLFYSGQTGFTEEELREILGKDGASEERSGMIDLGKEKVIFSICASRHAPLYFIMLKEDREVSRFMAEIRSVFLAVVLLGSIFVSAFLLLYYRQHRKYLSGLAQIVKATEEETPLEEKMMEKLADSFRGRGEDLEVIARKILEDNLDISELKRILGSERQLRTEVEMLYGHAQINSHFLLNTLDSIYWESVKSQGGDSEGTQMIERLCGILKYALDSSTPYISLEEEVECAKDYLEIQKMRKEMEIRVEWRIPETLKNAKVGKLMLQPILENSIQHGGFGAGQAIWLEVEAKVLEDALYLSVRDNGIGMEEAEMREMNRLFRQNVPVKSKHIGLMNVNRRIQLQYGEEYGIVLQPSDENGGLTVMIRLKYLTV